MRYRVLVCVLVLTGFAATSSGQVSRTDRPEDALAAIVHAFLEPRFVTGWEGVQQLPLIRWQPMPAMLDDCLPDGNCFIREGTVLLGDRRVAVVAAGARTITSSLYLRNSAAPIGEPAMLGALKARGFNAELVRCPAAAQQSADGNWFRLRHSNANIGVLSVHRSCDGVACERFVLSLGDEIPPLQPEGVRLYSERCGAGSNREPISLLLPHEQLGKGLAAYIPSSAAQGPYDWKTLASIAGGIQWTPGGPRTTDLSYRGDSNPYAQTGSASYAGRRYSSLASGTAAAVLIVSLEEMRLHPVEEDLLSALRSDGFTVRLVRCGPIYTESTVNWYQVTSARTKPVILKQSIRKDGTQFQDSYELRLDATLPRRDARDRDPGLSGCS